MRRSLLLAGLLGVLAVPAFAGSVAPGAVVFDEGSVVASLTGVPGDPTNGRAVYGDRKLGNCVACHANSDRPDLSFPGEVGPALDGVASRWEEAELRGIVVNSKMTFEDTIMPAFYRDSGYTRLLKDFEGQAILSAQQVEDVVAYLLTLKD